VIYYSHACTPDSNTTLASFANPMCHTDESRAPAPPRQGQVGEHGELELTSSDGNRFRAYAARPEGTSRAGVVILPDVRGLHPYYEDLTERFAEAGYHAIAIDYFGRSAGLGSRDDSFDWKAHFEKVTSEGVAKDVHAAVTRLRADSQNSKLPVFTVGFCFGGANSWRQSGEGHGLAGCIGFYGGRPMERAGAAIPKMSAPLLMLLAGADKGTPPAEFEEFAGLVRARGLEVESHTYPGAPHSFFDRSFAEHREACEDSWKRILEFTDRHTAKA
jgi:carboxymethylenebutenolidase